jgi:acetoin utilization protein AcuB
MNAFDLMRWDVSMVTISPERSAAEAYELMRTHGVHHLPVVEDGALVGLVSEHELLRALEQLDAHRGETPVDEVMTKHVVTVTPEDPLAEAIRLMNKHRFGCLPVVRGEKVLGLITLTDLLDYTARLTDEQTRREIAAEYEADG